MTFDDVRKKCCNVSEKVCSLYDKEPEWWNDFKYSFMETVVSNIIIETDDDEERKKLLDIIEEMLQDDPESDIYNLAAIAVVEPIYFICKYDYFIENSFLFGEETKVAAKKIKDYWEGSGT